MGEGIVIVADVGPWRGVGCCSGLPKVVEMREVTAQDLRDIIEEAIADSIEVHRSSREVSERELYERPRGRPTDEEIDDFIASNALFDQETQEQLLDPGLLGFQAKTARASATWLREFQRLVKDWATNNSWLGADLPWMVPVVERRPEESLLWRPSESGQPGWIAASPAALMLAADLIRAGRLLAELPWRKFEELIGELLETEGWTVNVTRSSRDGGVDVVATKEDATLGAVRAIWQAKRYGPTRKVRLSQVRELSGIVDAERATKGMVVTTSQLTKSAIDWIRRDVYRLGYLDAPKIESWVLTKLWGPKSDS